MLQSIPAEKSAVEESMMEQSAGDIGFPSLIPPEHPIHSDPTSQQESGEGFKVGKSSKIEYQGTEGSTLDHYLTLEVLFNALEDVSQKITADTFIIVDGWEECNMDSEDEFRRLFGVLKTLPWKICITSRRPPTDLDSAYCSNFQIRETDNAEDVRAFTENAIQHTLLQRYQGFRQKAVQNIMDLSQGM